MFKNLFLLPLLPLLMVGCAPRSVYVPMLQNSPLFDSTKEVKANLNLSFNHIELTGAYNPTKRFVSAVNLQFGAGVACYDLALGTYGSKNHWHYEAFLGAGYNSNIYYRDPNRPTIFKYNNKNGYDVLSLYNRYYVQPAFGYRNNISIYDVTYITGFSCRFSYLYFKRFTFREIDAAKTTNVNQPIFNVNRDYRNKGIFMLEPSISSSFTLGKFGLQLQLQGLIPFNSEMNLTDTRFSPDVVFSTGLIYRLKKTKKQLLPVEQRGY